MKYVFKILKFDTYFSLNRQLKVLLEKGIYTFSEHNLSMLCV